MAKAAKIIFIVLASVIAFAGVVCLGFWAFVRTIYMQRTCDFANIDNIELHAAVNIPDIKAYDCLYKKEQNTKMAYFEIDKEKVDMNEYIRKNHFRKLKLNKIRLSEFLTAASSIDASINASGLYYNSGSRNGETWQTLLDDASGSLWVTIRYRD